MSLANLIGHTEDVDPGYISEAAMEQLCTVILSENLTPDELVEAVSEATGYEVVTEKNIVKLDKNAKLQRAYKTGVLQCAAEDGRKEYKKLRTMWKMEAFLFKKLERMYKNKAMARAKEAVKKLKRSGSAPMAKAGDRAATKLGAPNKLLNSGIVATKKK